MVEKTKSENPLVAGFKKVPGLSIRLPTRALLYEANEVNDTVLKTGEIHIHPMSAKDELILKSPDLLLSGDGFEMVVKRCIPGIKTPLKLFQPDVDAILIGLRIATYGDDLSIRVDNPFYDSEKKGSAKELDYTVNLTPILAQSKYVEDLKDFVITLENKQVVTICPLRYEASLRIVQEDFGEVGVEEKDKEKVLQKKLKLFEETVLSMIREVDGITNREQVREWLEILPVSMFRDITEKVDFLANLGPSLLTKVKDPVSDETWDVALPINPADFFAFGPGKETPNESSNTQTS